jgi:hypothetical protein
VNVQPRFGHTRHGLPVHARVLDHLTPAAGSSFYARFNAWLAVKITTAVGTMTCAYTFAAFDLLALPKAIQGGLYGVVQWVASFFLQLVLLSIILVAQGGQARASDARAAKTFEDVEALRADLTIALDRLDIHTAGGIKDVLDAVAALRGDLAARPKHRMLGGDR